MGDFLFFIKLIILVLFINYGAFYFNKNKKIHIAGYGLIISILAPIITLIIGTIFVNIDKHTGGDGVGGALSAVMIGWSILLNGVIYLISGIILKISSAIKKRKNFLKVTYEFIIIMQLTSALVEQR